jgi:hypothetical protein
LMLEKSSSVLLLIVGCFVLSASQVASQSSQLSSFSNPPEFYVELDQKKSTFYGDEAIAFWIFRRASREFQSTKCSFGGWGQTFEVWEGGTLVKQFRLGPVSTTDPRTIGDSAYLRFGAVTLPGDFLTANAKPENQYQIRATCGDEVSAPSEPFTIDVWLTPVHGLQVRLRSISDEYRVGEPILIEATMRNVGKAPLVCPVPAADDGYEKSFWRFTANQYSLGDPRPQIAEDLLYSTRLDLLGPGESRTVTFALNHFQMIDRKRNTLFGNKPGKYRISVAVFFHDEPTLVNADQLWRGETDSNTIEIVIR